MLQDIIHEDDTQEQMQINTLFSIDRIERRAEYATASQEREVFKRSQSKCRKSTTPLNEWAPQSAKCKALSIPPLAISISHYMELSSLQPTTLFRLKASKKPLKSSFFTSTTECSKLSIRTRAPVSSTTSWNAAPKRLSP